MRLIDADILKNVILKWLPKDPCGREELEHPYEEDICISTIMAIEEQPTVDATPIVRCHECKHLTVYNCGYACDAGHWGKISKESNCGGMGDFFCAEGERK